MKHFEDIWNLAEALSKQNPELNITTHFLNIKKLVDEVALAELYQDKTPGKQAEIIGKILYELCAITQLRNINSAAALKFAMEEKKAELLDPDNDSA